MSTKTPQKPRSKKPSAVITYEEVHIAEALDLVPTLSEAHKEQALRILLHPDGQAALRWREFAATNPTNAELRERLVQLWRLGEKRDQPLCCASAVTGNPLVFFGQDHVRGTPSLSGDELYEAVRKVLHMGDAPEDDDGNTLSGPRFEQLKRQGKSQAKPVDEPIDKAKPKNHIGTPKPVPKAIGMATVVQSRVEISMKLIDDSPYQTRSEPSAAEIAELAHSIKTVGLLKPLRLRKMPGGRFQQIGGHRRRRALAQLGQHVALCDIVECDDATAALEVREDNKQEPLNAIEKARGLKVIFDAYQAAGRSQREMAEDLGIEQGTISNQIRLLGAPAPLQQRLISGDISQPQVRQLIPWAYNEKLVARFQKELDNRCRTGPVSRNHWESCLSIAINSISKSVTKHSGYTLAGDPLFDCSKHAETLDIREFTIDGRKERRAFNVTEWNRLQAEAKKKKEERESKKAAAAPKAKSAARAVRTDRSSWKFRNAMTEAWDQGAWVKIGKHLGGKITKPQKAAAARLLSLFSFESESDPEKLLKLSAEEYADLQFTWLLEEFGQDCPYCLKWKDLMAIAAHFGVDLISDWTPTRELLDVCELIDLQDIASEMPVEPFDPSDAKNLLVNQLLLHWPAGWVPALLDPDPKSAKKAKK